ncbi:hypothetical protein Droror1_Dr00000353 [Drosera rotundifolia]
MLERFCVSGGFGSVIGSSQERLQSKLLSEMASRLASDLSTPALKWGPWLYYRRVKERKQFLVLCWRLASLNEEFISNKLPSGGFYFASGKKIEQVLVDYNKEAERLGVLRMRRFRKCHWIITILCLYDV